FAYYPAAGGHVTAGAEGPTAGFESSVGPLSDNVEYRLAMQFADAISYELRRTSDDGLVNYANPIPSSVGVGIEPHTISYNVVGPARVELRSIVAAGP